MLWQSDFNRQSGQVFWYLKRLRLELYQARDHSYSFVNWWLYLLARCGEKKKDPWAVLYETWSEELRWNSGRYTGDIRSKTCRGRGDFLWQVYLPDYVLFVLCKLILHHIVLVFDCIPGMHQLKEVNSRNFFCCRKGRYSINLQLICDDKRRILYFVIGFHVLSQCPLFQDAHEFFS